MIETLFNELTKMLNEGYWLALVAATGWGVLSILLSPCHLSSIPLIVGVVSADIKQSVRRSFFVSCLFSGGILLSILAIGIITALAGRMWGDIGSVGNVIVALVLVLVGLYLMDLIRLPSISFNINRLGRNTPAAAFFIGLLFGVSIGPCTFAYMAPVLSAVYQVSKTNMLRSILLLIFFSVGHVSLIVLAGTSSERVRHYLNWTESTKAIIWIRRICGLLVAAAGIYLFVKSI
ncbi:cytochrome c biogenesis CcdA family protein [Candidatus Neomarinimicrobiota bacterium]